MGSAAGPARAAAATRRAEVPLAPRGLAAARESGPPEPQKPQPPRLRDRARARADTLPGARADVYAAAVRRPRRRSNAAAQREASRFAPHAGVDAISEAAARVMEATPHGGHGAAGDARD